MGDFGAVAQFLGEERIFRNSSPDLGRLIDAVFGDSINEASKLSDLLRKDIDFGKEVFDVFDEIFATLTPREEKIVKMRFGLGSNTQPLSQLSVGYSLGLSQGRISQLEQKALRKLRHPSRSRRIRGFLEEAVARQIDPPSDPILVDYVVEKVKELTPQLITHLRRYNEDLTKVHPRVFEHLIAEFFASWGCEDVRLVGQNAKTSADIYVANFTNPTGLETRIFVEVKRWKQKVGIEVIDQVLGAFLSEREKYGWHAAVIVTASGFTEFEKWNREELRLKGLELRDKNDLISWLDNYQERESGLWLPAPKKAILDERA